LDSDKGWCKVLHSCNIGNNIVKDFIFHATCCQNVIVFVVVQLVQLQLLWLLPHNWCYEENLKCGPLVMWFDMGYTIVHYCYNDLDLGTHDLMRGREIGKNVREKSCCSTWNIFQKIIT
jgi:hypothetical protein